VFEGHSQRVNGESTKASKSMVYFLCTHTEQSKHVDWESGAPD
jgi:hypothetical protein